MSSRKRVVTVRLDAETYKALKRAADAERRSLGGMGELYIWAGLAADKKAKAPNLKASIR
jgi:hypothetical protein